jgi:hypothetical protein
MANILAPQQTITNCLTDPRNHDPENFVYLVHGRWLDPCRDYEDSVRYIASRIKDPNLHFRTSLIGKLNKDVAKGVFNDDAIGDVEQLGISGTLGLIIEPSISDIIRIAWNCDLQSPLDPETFRSFAERYDGKLRNAQTLLERTVGSSHYPYNELVLRGNKDTSVSGVCYTLVNSDRLNAITLEYAEIFQEMFRKLFGREIPLIELPVPTKQPPRDYNRNKKLVLDTLLDFYFIEMSLREFALQIGLTEEEYKGIIEQT